MKIDKEEETIAQLSLETFNLYMWSRTTFFQRLDCIYAMVDLTICTTQAYDSVIMVPRTVYVSASSVIFLKVPLNFVRADLFMQQPRFVSWSCYPVSITSVPSWGDRRTPLALNSFWCIAPVIMSVWYVIDQNVLNL